MSGIFIVVFAGLGVHYLSTSHAATATAQFEVEAGNQIGTSTVDDSSASGGKAIKFSNGGTAADTSALPFTMASTATLQSKKPLVFAHYFAPYPLSFDNANPASDSYQNNYLNPNYSGFAAYGGQLRERPLPVAPGGTNWQLLNMETEVRQAEKMGLDGFTVDILGLSGSNWDMQQTLMQAAHIVDPNFKIVLMPDSNDKASTDQGYATYARAIASIAHNPSVYHLADGRLVVAPFYPENSLTGPVWWQNFINTMQTTYGITVAFVPCFLDATPANMSNFASMSYGYSSWGGRSPTGSQGYTNSATASHNAGKIWMQPVSLQDERPNQSNYFEADNTENLRMTWDAAISTNADWVQIPTWNDYSEGAEIAPSTHVGWGAADINSYYIYRYKLGNYPTINKDVIYISHRSQFANATINPSNSAYTTRMKLRAASNPARDDVEVLSFLTRPATITVHIGNTTQTYSAPAGQFAQLYPLQTGSISASVTRSGTTVTSVTSPFPVLANPTIQDEHYNIVSSGRSGGLGTAAD